MGGPGDGVSDELPLSDEDDLPSELELDSDGAGSKLEHSCPSVLRLSEDEGARSTEKRDPPPVQKASPSLSWHRRRRGVDSGGELVLPPMPRLAAARSLAPSSILAASSTKSARRRRNRTAFFSSSSLPTTRLLCL